MKRTLSSIGILATLLTANYNKNAMMLDKTQAVETYSLFSIRISVGFVALPTATRSTNVNSYLDQHLAGYH